MCTNRRKRCCWSPALCEPKTSWQPGRRWTRRCDRGAALHVCVACVLRVCLCVYVSVWHCRNGAFGCQAIQIMAYWLNSVVDEATNSTRSTFRRVLLKLTPASLEQLYMLRSPSPSVVRVVGVVCAVYRSVGQAGRNDGWFHDRCATCSKRTPPGPMRFELFRRGSSLCGGWLFSLQQMCGYAAA